MSRNVLISICIPAYKDTTYLKRLLDSISIQTFKDYEVIVTDDSPDDSVKYFIEDYTPLREIKYLRNLNPLGTPENWNEGIRKATGQWIKIMHDDDWFAEADSLLHFANATNQQKGDFIFSAYRNVFLDLGTEEIVRPASHRLRMLEKEPYTLFSKNIIGPPSVTLHRNDKQLFYDRKTKWVVDIDFYIRRLEEEHLQYIDKPLINVGMSSLQVTVDCIHNRKVQVPENFYLLKKVGTYKLNNIWIYDAWWRLIRNLEITETKHITEAGYNGTIPTVIMSMIQSQKAISRSILTNALFSKMIMFAHYRSNRNKISN